MDGSMRHSGRRSPYDTPQRQRSGSSAGRASSRASTPHDLWHDVKNTLGMEAAPVPQRRRSSSRSSSRSPVGGPRWREATCRVALLRAARDEKTHTVHSQ